MLIAAFFHSKKTKKQNEIITMARNQSKLFEMTVFGMWRRKKYTITRFKLRIQRKQI